MNPIVRIIAFAALLLGQIGSAPRHDPWAIATVDPAPMGAAPLHDA